MTGFAEMNKIISKILRDKLSHQREAKITRSVAFSGNECGRPKGCSGTWGQSAIGKDWYEATSEIKEKLKLHFHNHLTTI